MHSGGLLFRCRNMADRLDGVSQFPATVSAKSRCRGGSAAVSRLTDFQGRTDETSFPRLRRDAACGLRGALFGAADPTLLVRGRPDAAELRTALVPNVEAATFTGEARITIDSDAELPAVTMNALDLNVTRATIDNQQVTTSVDDEAQTLTLTPRRALRAGRHTHPHQSIAARSMTTPTASSASSIRTTAKPSARIWRRNSSRAMRAASRRCGTSPTAAPCSR